MLKSLAVKAPLILEHVHNDCHYYQEHDVVTVSDEEHPVGHVYSS